MVKKGIIFLAIFSFVLTLGGCATGRKQKDMEMQGLRNQVSVLEAQIQSKDEEINSLKEALDKATAEKERAAKIVGKNKVISEVKSRPNVKQIQVTLKNAGYDPGPIDGRIGKQTTEAIRAFQKANNLVSDGKVGKRTWALLREYLEKKIK